MANEFIIKNGFRSQGNSQITGSISVLNGATIFNNLTINTSNLPVLNLFDSLQSHTWQFRSNGTSLFFQDNGTTRMWIGGVGSGNGGKIGINVINTTAQLTIRGSGATSGTTALLVQNANASSSLIVADDRLVTVSSKLQVGTFTPGVATGSSTIFTTGRISAAGGVTLYNPVSGDDQNIGIFNDSGLTIYHASTTVARFNTVGGGSNGTNVSIAQSYNPGAGSGTVTGYAHAYTMYPSADNTINYNSYYSNPSWAGGSYYDRLTGVIRGFYFINSLYVTQKLIDVRAIETIGGRVIFTGNTPQAFSGSLYGVSITHTISASANNDKLAGVYIQPTFFNSSYSGVTNNALQVSGSTYLYKSGSTVLDIQGSQGQLFSVVDALSGSLMSVNDVSGLPILEVFSDDRVVMGTYGAPALIVTGSNTVISGSLRGRVVTLSTASATASMDCSLSNFFDLTLSGSMFLGVSNIQPGETINLRVTQPAVSGSLNYTSSIKFPNGLPYAASATGSVTDLISFISFDSSTLYATSLKNLV